VLAGDPALHEATARRAAGPRALALPALMLRRAIRRMETRIAPCHEAETKL